MSSRRRLTRPTAIFAAVFVVLGVGGGASALGDVNANVSETVTLPGVSTSVNLCVKLKKQAVGVCESTPPLSEGATLTVTAASSTEAPDLVVGSCAEGTGVAILVTTHDADASVSATVAGITLNGEPVAVGVDEDVPAGEEADVSACITV